MAYTIKSGDTLSGIATANKTDVNTLLKLNPTIKDPNKIIAGSALTLPGATPAPAPSFIAPVAPSTSPVSTTPTLGVSKPAVPNMSTFSSPAPAAAPAPAAPAAPKPVAPAPVASGSGYGGASVVDYLTSIGQPSDYNSRAALAAKYGIAGYTGSADQNTLLLSKLRGGAAPAAPAPTFSAPTVPQTSDGQNINPATGGVSTAAPAAPAVPDIKSVLAEIEKYSTYSPEEEQNANAIANLESGLAISKANISDQPIPLEFITGQKASVERRALALEQPLQAKAALLQAKRLASLDAAKTKLAAVSPTKVTAGESIVDPITGKTIASGTSLSDKNALDTFFNIAQTYPDAGIKWNDALTPQQNLAAAQAAAAKSPSFQAKNTVYAINPLTGEPTIISKMGGGGSVGGGGSSGGGTGGLSTANLAPELKGALSNISGVQYFDSGKVTSSQLPYLQRAANQLGIPIISKEDANKLQDAFSSFNSANSLVTQIVNLTGSVLTAPNDPGSQTAQAARLKAIELAPALSTDNNAKQFISARNSVLSLLTRAAGEKGVLTNQDIERVASALPSYSDSATLAAQKAANFSNVLQSVLSGAIQAYLGTAGGGSTGGGSYTGTTSSGMGYTVLP